MTITEFMAKWRRVELKERSAAQEHFLDLCHAFEHPTPAEADPTGEKFCFEKGAMKHGSSGVPATQGFADVWKRGFFGWEYKGRHKDLDAAYDQLLRYRNALENPPLLVVCDLDRIVIHTNFTGTVSARHEIPLEALAEPRNIEIMRAVFHKPEALRPGRTSAAVTQDAARRFAELAAALRERGLDPAAVAHFLDRIVFCLFAEDTGLLPDLIFTKIIDKAAGDAARFGKMLGQLFDTMATGGDFGIETIRHFNGNLFDDCSVLDLTPDDIKRIAAAAALDWSAVDPSIFGTLFERGLDPAKRSQLGAHFTGMEDIELVVDAVVMAPLRREWEETRTIVERLLTTGRKTPGSAGVPPAFERLDDSSRSNTAAKMAALPGDCGSAALPEYDMTTLPGPDNPPREWHCRGYLPHFDHPGIVQSITFRLADSLPEELLTRLSLRADFTNDPAVRREIEEALDASHGACHLRDPRLAKTVQDALLHFDGERYRLLAWVVMLNHVHVLIETQPGFRLDEVVHSWKSFTAKACNRLLHRTGAFWQEDYFDRYIRNEEHYRKTKDYIEQNPVKSGLVATSEAWPFGSARHGSAPGSAGVPPAAHGTYVSRRLDEAAGTAALPGAGTEKRPAKPLSPAQLRKARSEADTILHQFLVRLRAVRILDPACGSGNFLYVALLRLKDLEREAAVTFPSEHGLASYLPGVGPWQLHGIELNAYAHDLAQMTVWIGWLQWIRVNGFGFPAEPILRPLSKNIRLMDAILTGSAGVPPAFEHVGDSPGSKTAARMAALPGECGPASLPRGVPAEPEWPAVDFIIGNPPFLGGKLLRRELGDAYVDRLFALWRGRVPPEADLCCYWFEKTRAHIAAGKCKRAGLLATQGIRGGANREVLKRIKETGDIFWAESDRPWIQDGANVHVSMVGFDNGEEKDRYLDGLGIRTIHANLTGHADTDSAIRLPSNVGVGFMGTTKQGPFDIEEDIALKWLDSPNPHGRPNSDVLMPWINGMAVTKRTDLMWIIDFFNMTEAEARLYETPFAYVIEHVKKARDASPRKWHRAEWWQLYAQRPEMRRALEDLPRFIVTPNVSKHRLFAWEQAPTNPDHQLIVYARSDDLFFGILHSRIHEVWARAQGTQLREKESGFRYTPTTCFETFPFPGSAGVPPAFERVDDSPGSKTAARMAALPGGVGDASLPEYAGISAAARELNALRERWLNPPEWTREEVLEFPGTVGGPWDRYIVRDAGGTPALPAGAVGTVRYPRLVPRDAECATRLKNRTLTKLYNERPAWLADAHARLDAAVAAAYGWPADQSDEAILERLLELNRQRSQVKCNADTAL